MEDVGLILNSLEGVHSRVPIHCPAVTGMLAVSAHACWRPMLYACTLCRPCLGLITLVVAVVRCNLFTLSW